MAVWTVYIVECADGTLYTGVATDVVARVATHNAGKGAKYTRGRLPVRLRYQEAAADRGAALKREHAIKRLSRASKRKLLPTRRLRAAGSGR
jgi:putative endonuclease